MDLGCANGDFQLLVDATSITDTFEILGVFTSTTIKEIKAALRQRSGGIVVDVKPWSPSTSFCFDDDDATLESVGIGPGTILSATIRAQEQIVQQQLPDNSEKAS